MRRLLRSLLAAGLALAFTGGVPVTMAVSAATVSPHPCEKASHPCNEGSFIRCCCAEDTHGLPVSEPPTERTSLSKTQVNDAILGAAADSSEPAVLARDLHASATHRPGPPISLSILHASLLL